jgi:hypothetical protein
MGWSRPGRPPASNCSANKTFDDVTFLAATPQWLADATLHVTGIPGDLDFNWLINLEYGVPGKDPGTGEQLPFRFPKLSVKDGQRVGVSAHGHNRFIILDVISSGDPIIVSQGHASDELGHGLTFNRPGAVYHLAMALAKGQLRQLDQPVPEVPQGGSLPELQPGRLYDAFFESIDRHEIPGQPLVRVMIMLFYSPMESTNPVGIAFMDDEGRLPTPVIFRTPSRFEDRKVSRRALLPGPPDAPSPPVASLPAEGRLRRIRALAKWDREPAPVKLETLVVVELSKLAIPIDEDLHTDPNTTTGSCDGDAEDADFLRFLLRLAWDDRTGQARWTGAVDSAGDQDGLKKFCNTRVFGLLLLAGPMLAADPPVDEADGATLRWIAVGTLLPAAFLLTRGDEPVIRNVDVTLHGVSFELDAREGPFSDPVAVRFKLDYSVAFEVHEKKFGLKSKTDPTTGKVTKMTARFREVGLEIRDLGDFGSPGHIGLDHFNLLFDPSKGGSIDIVDPGAYDLDGPLGKLLGITAARIGHGSLFFEFDMAFLLDLGVVEVTQATLRITFGEDGPSAELRGLKAGVDIDQVIVGEGELKVLDNGQIKTALDLDVIPAGVKASGQLDLLPQADFTAVAVGLEVEYSTGLPLGSTGLGIYGFFGLFAANMARSVDRQAPNRVTAELAWLGQTLRGVGSPWLPQRQAWGFGVGAVIGILPDSARSFHAKGGLVLELPGPGVIFGIDAAFLKKRRKAKNPT